MKVDSYKPKLNDYVKWCTPWRNVEGWVYFVDVDYITIEISVRDKDPADLEHSSFHRKHHVLLLCHQIYWNELIYVRSR
jgi:hypothetical protein